MKLWCAVVCLFLVAGVIELPDVLAASRPIASNYVDQFAGGRKSITVYADNQASALAKAQSQNPGWSVVSVKKVNKDPKSKAYRVVLKK